MPVVLPAKTYEISQGDNGIWEIRLQGEVVERHQTQQRAIDVAKARAAQEGAAVEWDDPQAGKQGPVRPSRFGVVASKVR